MGEMQMDCHPGNPRASLVLGFSACVPDMSSVEDVIILIEKSNVITLIEESNASNRILTNLTDPTEDVLKREVDFKSKEDTLKFDIGGHTLELGRIEFSLLTKKVPGKNKRPKGVSYNVKGLELLDFVKDDEKWKNISDVDAGSNPKVRLTATPDEINQEWWKRLHEYLDESLSAYENSGEETVEEDKHSRRELKLERFLRQVESRLHTLDMESTKLKEEFAYLRKENDAPHEKTLNVPHVNHELSYAADDLHTMALDEDEKAVNIYLEWDPTSGPDNDSDNASIHNEAPNNHQQPNIQPQIITTVSNNNTKFPYLKKDDLKRTGRDSDGGLIILPPTTAEEHLAVQRESKARTTLLQSILDDHIAYFHYMDDARDIWNAVKARFGGNAKSKKMRKSMLKQEFSYFRISEAEGLHKGYDRMQKILSQLNQLKAKQDAKDINIRFLKALPSSWSQVSLTLKTKGGLEFLSFDVLYYKLKTLEVDVKGYNTFSSSQSAGPSHSVFVSTTSTSKKMPYGDSLNYSSTTTYSVPSISKTGSHKFSNEIKDVIQSFVADTEPEQQLAYEDLKQIEKLDLEEMDLKWQMAMLSIRVHRFEQKAGRKIDFDKKDSARFNKKKVKCYKCQQRGHFARECRAKGGNDKQIYSSFKIKEIGKKEEDSKALITVIHWLIDAIKEGATKLYNLINGANSEEANTTGVAGEFAFMGVTSETKFDNHLVQTEKWRNSSKNLYRLIDSSMSVRTKVGLGFTNCISENELGWDDSAFSVFTTTSEDVEGRPTFHRFAKTNSMKAVPPPLSGDYTSLSDHIDLDESKMSYGTKSSNSCDSKSVSNDFVSCDDSDKSSKVNTNNFAFSDSSVKSLEQKTTDSTSCASTSSDLPSFTCHSSDKTEHTSRTSCNKNGSFNKKAGHFRKNASSVSKLCFVYGSGTHLINDCDFYEKQMANTTIGLGVGPAVRPQPVPTGKPKVKPVPTGKPKVKSVPNGKPKVTLVPTGKPKVTPVSTGKPKVTPVPTGKSQVSTPVPTGRLNRPFPVPTGRGYSPSVIFGQSFSAAEDEGIFDSGCSRSMTGNKERLDDFQAFYGGKVTFGGGEGRITGKGTIRTPTLDFENVYYVKELQQFNLFSISQICNKKNQVLFTDTECLVLSKDFKLPDDSMVVLKVPRKHNLYTINLNNLCPRGHLACLVAHASFDECVKWHRRMAHVNYKNMNRLVKGNLVRGLPPKLFKNGHTCVACCKGKQHKASYKAINAVSSISEPLQLLHMDLFGPFSIRSIDHKYYCLVITDDYSRFCCVFFLEHKDETYPTLKSFINLVKNQLSKRVKAIRCDNGTEFKNAHMIDLCGSKGIKREYSNPRTPQQNRVAERKNRTLIEAARTMLADSKLPTMFWTEAVRTACYVLNRVFVTSPHNKIPYALLTRNIPSVSHFKPFGCHVTILNTSDHFGKFDGKADEGYIVRYSDTSRCKSCSFWLYTSSYWRVPVPTGSILVPTGSIPVPTGNTTVLTDDDLVHSSSSTDSMFDGEPITRFPCPSDLGNHDPSPGIFSSSSYDDEYDTALNNVASSVEVSPVPTKRINTIHPQSLIIRDPTSAVQTRSKALEDPSWVDAMQEEMQQFKFQNQLLDYGAPELGPPAILATIDRTPYTIIEDLVRSRLQLADDGGVADLPILEIYFEMDNLGYVTEGKLTFFKKKNSPQWRFLVHTLLHCLSPKSGSWDQFGSLIAIALICLSNGRRFNWSNYIFRGMVSNIGNAKNFLMEPYATFTCYASLSSSRTQSSDPVAPVLEHDHSSDQHNTAVGSFPTREDAPLGSNFHTSPTRSSHAPPTGEPSGGAEDPITLTVLSYVVSTLVQKVHSLKAKLHDHKKLFKDVVGKLVKKVKTLEVKLKTKKRKMVVSDFDQEDGTTPNVDLDALRALANAAVAVDSDIPSGSTSQIPAASLCAPTTVLPGASGVPPCASGVPHGAFDVSPGAFVAPTAALAVLVDSPKVPAAVPADSLNIPAGVSSKGKSPMVEEDIPVTAKTFRQMKEDRLGEEAAKRLHAKEMAHMERERAEVQRKRQQEALESAMYYNESDWLNIRTQVEANASLSKTLLGDDMSEDNFPARMAALIKQKRQALAEQLFKERQNRPLTPAQQKAYVRKYVKNQSSAIYNTGWTMAYVKSFSEEQLKQEFEKIRKSPEAPTPSMPEVLISPAVTSLPSSRTRRKSLGHKHMHKPKSTLPTLDLDAPAQTFLKVVVDKDSDDDDSIDEVWSVVVGWEVLPTPLGEINALYRIDGSTKHFATLRQILHLVDRHDLMKLYGLVVQYYEHHPAAGAGLLFRGGL
nr:putative ribonuclease H-like domain-containing protein [Tanacetum cinerariifolium]